MSDNNANKRIAINSILLSIRMVFVLGINLFTTRAVLGLLGVEDYGVYNVVCGFVTMFTFLNTAMSNGIQRFFNFELGKNGIEGAQKVYSTAVIIQVLLSIIIIVIAESFGLWYLYNKMVIPDERFIAALWLLQMSVFSFFFVIMQAPFTAAVMAHEKMNFFAVMSVFDAVAKLLIVYIVPLFGGDKLIIYGILFALISVVDFSVYYLYCKRNFEEVRFKKPKNKAMFKAMLGFSGWNMFGSLSTLMKEQGINLVMNFFFGPVVNAARGVSMQVSSGLQNLVQNIAIPVRPQVVQSFAQGNVERSMSLTFSVSKLSCMFLYMASLPILLELDYVLKIWLGDNIPDHTYTFVYIIVLTSFLNNLNSAISGVVHASGQMRLYQIAGGLVGILSVPVAYIVLSMGGRPESALWVVFISMMITQTNALIILKTIVKYSITSYIRQVILPFVYVVILTLEIPLIPLYLMEQGFIRFIIVTIACIVFISLSIYVVGLNSSEKILIQGFVSKIKQKANIDKN